MRNKTESVCSEHSNSILAHELKSMLHTTIYHAINYKQFL